MFNIVKFPNDECKGDGGKNGTCYTGLTLKGLLLMVVINQFRVQLQPPSATCGRELQPAAAQMVTESAALVSLNQIVFFLSFISDMSKMCFSCEKLRHHDQREQHLLRV